MSWRKNPSNLWVKKVGISMRNWAKTLWQILTSRNKKVKGSRGKCRWPRKCRRFQQRKISRALCKISWFQFRRNSRRWSRSPRFSHFKNQIRGKRGNKPQIWRGSSIWPIKPTTLKGCKRSTNSRQMWLKYKSMFRISSKNQRKMKNQARILNWTL